MLLNKRNKNIRAKRQTGPNKVEKTPVRSGARPKGCRRPYSRAKGAIKQARRPKIRKGEHPKGALHDLIHPRGRPTTSKDFRIITTDFQKKPPFRLE